MIIIIINKKKTRPRSFLDVHNLSIHYLKTSKCTFIQLEDFSFKV